MAENSSLQRLAEVLNASTGAPVAIIAKQGAKLVSVYSGEVLSAERLASIPLETDDVLALVPFHQIVERGFEAVVGEEDLLYMRVKEKWEVSKGELKELLPTRPLTIGDGAFDISDEDYAALVEKVIDEEIGSGGGANFVLRRTYRARTETPQKEAALAWFSALLSKEVGAYWTFMFFGGGVAAVGASPERHVSVEDGTVLMNPISGTMRHGSTAPTEAELLAFLQDTKESEELVMVVDEELKMMSAVCPDGGVMHGPYLKPMSRLTHTEYLLEGRSRLDPREVLRLTMFAPTVVGSPMGAACEVIAKHEGSPRGYYSGVLALFERRGNRFALDAPILIRTAFIDPQGEVEVSAGATLVRHSNPMEEAKETHVKVSGVLSAVANPADDPAADVSVGSSADPAAKPLTDLSGDATVEAKVFAPAAQAAKGKMVGEALQARNANLAPFWRDEQMAPATVAGQVLVIDWGDGFADMLAHQLRHLGLSCRVLDWRAVQDEEPEDLVIFGSGTGDPRVETEKTTRLKELLQARLGQGKPLAATSFSHLVLAGLAGLPIVQLDHSHQGVALDVDFLGEESLLGFYTTFAALGEDGTKTPALDLTITSIEDPLTGVDQSLVTSLEGNGVVSTAAHLESALSRDGFDALSRMVIKTLQSQG